MVIYFLPLLITFSLSTKIAPLNTLEHARIINGGAKIQARTTAGLGSIDRNNKATLLFTPPGCTTKSYAKGLSLRIVKLQYVS